ncbi:EamA/RhaT family transporter [Aestuariivirga litoralis]|uniref:EamA/RhaT family transporter n=1 Tax=Aestuariivirga litoralis TaxID=2650924 RepID=A0A2W2ANT9_9HYPH|nr:DMT family transporter [Aestuariivirga litoralis]PZF77105.1 EamA/RhaT family transporter [Aestuariivirga litoralis]
MNQTSPALSRNLTGVISLCAGVFVFSMQDAILKGLSGEHAVTLAIVLRSIVGLPLLLAMVWYENGLGALRTRNWKLLVARGLILLTSYTTYYLAFPALPMAEAVALFFTSPIFVTILAALFLREKVTLKAWAAVIAGFVGVLIILRPGTGLFEPAALLSLLSAAAYALSMVLARRYSADESTTVMAFYVNAVYMVAAAGVALAFHLLGITHAAHPSLEFLVRPWALPDLTDLALMGLCGVIAALGMILLTHAYRLARANLVTVFEYTGMLWVPLWGFLFFAEVPKWTTVLGTVIIIAAGIFAVRTARP